MILDVTVVICQGERNKRKDENKEELVQNEIEEREQGARTKMIGGKNTKDRKRKWKGVTEESTRPDEMSGHGSRCPSLVMSFRGG